MRLILPLLLLCAACSTLPQAALDYHHRVRLPALMAAPVLYRQQLLTITRVGKSEPPHTLMMVLQASSSGVHLVGLTPLGIRLFRIDYDRHGLGSEVLPALDGMGKLPPESQILADVMLCYWPIASWQPLLPAGWSLQDEGDQRLLRDEQGKLVSEIHYQVQGVYREPVRLWHHLFNYQLSLQTLVTAEEPSATGAAP